MNKFHIFLCLLLSTIITYGQNDPIMNSMFSEESQYLFKRFQNGTIVFDNNSVIESKLNYNVIFEEMHFLDKGNTIKSLATKNIIRVKTDQYLFLYINESFYLVVYQNSGIELLQQFKPILKNTEENTGAYGTSVASSTSTKIQSVRVGTQYSDEMIDVVVKPENQIKIKNKFFIRHNESFYEVTRKNLHKIFPDQESQLKEYLKSNKSDLSSKDDIIELLNNLIPQTNK